MLTVAAEPATPAALMQWPPSWSSRIC